MPVPAARSSRLFELGRLTSELRAAPPEAAERRLTEVAGVDDRAGRDLLAYLEPGGRDGCACSAPVGMSPLCNSLRGMLADFDALVAEALAEPTEGWNFARFGARMRSTHPSWRYWDLVAEAAASAPSLLDIGTGGGEQLAGFCERAAARPRLTVATESWPPNVPVAARRLAPLGILVVHAEGAPDNDEQAADEVLGRLPFRDDAFALVIDRHEAFNAREVARVLAPEGVFITQHVGSDYRDLHDLLDEPWTPVAPVDRALVVRQVTAAGLTVEAGDEAEVVLTFADVGALGWYLRQVPWAVPTVAVERDPERLRAAHERILADGPVRARQQQFWLRAVKR